MKNVKIALSGIGNCTSSLVQGTHFYGSQSEAIAEGINHWAIDGYTPGDIDGSPPQTSQRLRQHGLSEHAQQGRVEIKKISKTKAVKSMMVEPLPDGKFTPPLPEMT
jgi:myo-inositol-1-phosphate synthase